MKKVIVLGGGLAGLSSAVFLAQKNIPVLLLEASNRPGGRVSSFYDPVFKSVIDNGQHIMMGCYTNTLRYLKITGALQNFYFQKDLEVNFFKEGGIYPLKSGKGIYPYSLINGLLKFQLLSFRERLDLLRFISLLPLSSRRDLEKINAERWLKESGQNDNVRNIFWNTFIIGALNTSPDKASALLLRKVLLQVFYTGKNSSAIIIPDKPLTEAFCDPAVKYLHDHNSEVIYSERIIRLVTDQRANKIVNIITNRRVLDNFSLVISALPLFSLNKIINMNDHLEFNPVYSSILTIHLRSREELFKVSIVSCVDSIIHWIFKHPEHYTIVISNADKYKEMTNEEIRKIICGELVRLFSIQPGIITALRIIKEKRATFIPSADMLNRPGTSTSYNNLLLAGDWTSTGLPATIEGAVSSGYKAAQYIN